MFRKKHICCYSAYILMGIYAFVLFDCPPARADVDSSLDMAEYVRNSGLIFKGKVTRVEYKNS